MNNLRSVTVIPAIAVILLIVGILFSIGWYMVSQNNSDSDVTANSRQTDDPSASRDDVRKRHAARLATRLFTMHLVQKQYVPVDQTGWAMLLVDEIDPQTNEPYVFNDDQSTMRIGEATFRTDASCDNKIKGSKGTGLIVDATPSSVAVAIKLESGAFACETNL